MDRWSLGRDGERKSELFAGVLYSFWATTTNWFVGGSLPFVMTMSYKAGELSIGLTMNQNAVIGARWSN